MFLFAVFLLLIALIAGLFGYNGAAAHFAEAVFYISLVCFILTLLFGLSKKEDQDLRLSK